MWLAELVVSGRRPLEQGGRGNVHVGRPALQVQERGIEAGEAIGAHCTDHRKPIRSVSVVTHRTSVRCKRRTGKRTKTKSDSLIARAQRAGGGEAETAPLVPPGAKGRDEATTIPPAAEADSRGGAAAAGRWRSARRAHGAAAAPTAKAEIDASAHSVPIGDRVVLEGSFPGAARAPIAVPLPGQGLRIVAHGSPPTAPAPAVVTGCAWSPIAAATGAPSSGAEHTAPGGGAVPAEVDADTGTERVEVRSRTRARVAGRDQLVGDRVEVRGTVSPRRRRAARRDPRRRREARCRGRPRRPLQRSSGGRRTRGRSTVEARARSNRTATGSRDSAGRLTVYRPAAASWYGPGLYGNALACGGTLSAVDDGRRPPDACPAGPRSACATATAR